MRFFYKFLCLLTIGVLNSCATIINKTTTIININTATPTKLIINKDTLSDLTTVKAISVKRQNERLTLKVFNDSLDKTVYVDPVNSTAYVMNHFLLPMYFMVIPAGLIDGKKDIRYGYPKHIYLDVNVNDGNYFTEKTIPINEKNIIAFSPLILLLDVINPSIDFTYERKLNNRFTLQGRLSKLVPYSILLGSKFKNLIGLRWGGEVRYFMKNNAPKGFYLGLEVNKLRAKYNTTSQFTSNLLAKNDEDYYWDNFGVEKRTLNFNLKTGYQFIHKQLVFDVYGGLGIKDRNVAHLHRYNLNDAEVSYRHPNVYQISNKKGHTTGINLIFNSRIGFAF